HHGPAAEGRDLLDDPGAHLPEALGRVEDPGDVLGFELVDRQQVLDHHKASWAGGGAPWPTPTASSPSSSDRSTWTSWSARVGTFLPTKSGRIGSSRWPRSTRTASRIAFALPKSTSASIAARTVRPVNST